MTPRRVLVAGHDLKFMASIPTYVRSTGAELREDLWRSHAGPPSEASHELIEWADTVLCEWCLGNAVWYSNNARPGQRIVIRFHRFELETEYPAAVDVDRVARIVFVSEHMLEEAAGRLGWSRDSLTVIPNTIDHAKLTLSKLPASTFNLGIVGFVPRRKRLDRALDVLERLRFHDGRFRLIAKGHPPWAQDWVWRRRDERSYFERVYERLRTAPLLRGAVSFEAFGQDVPSFLQKVGFILSTSDHEGHQVGLAEAMASGAIPVVTARAGALDQYPSRWVHADPHAAAKAIRELVDRGELQHERDRARGFTERWSVDAIEPRWREALALPEP